MRIGILTGGGDVPGLNPCIKQVVYQAIDQGHEVIGLRRGWGGILELDRDDPDSIKKNTIPLDKITVRKIDRSGGTFLHSSRTYPGKVKPCGQPMGGNARLGKAYTLNNKPLFNDSGVGTDHD